MMEWERPWMKRTADIICQNGGDILNVGFGLGIVDSYIQEKDISSHTVMEFHPDVLNYMKENGWYDKVNVIEGDWRDNMDKLGTYDGVFFDAYFGDKNEFESLFLGSIKRYLNPNGIFSYWYTTDRESENLVEFCSKRELEINYERIPISIPEQHHENGGTYLSPYVKEAIIPIIVNKSKSVVKSNSLI
jgi:spermidine synthase